MADVFRTRNSTTVTVVEIASHRLDEAALFHKFNAAKEADHGLLMVAHEPPSLWALRLPDLASRLAATPLVTIGAPDDKVLAAVLIKQLRDRGLLAPPAVIDYLAVRMERSFAAVHTLAQILDAAALASQRALTVKFVGKVLDDLPSQDII